MASKEDSQEVVVAAELHATIDNDGDSTTTTTTTTTTGDKQAHVLMVSYPGQGHINPAMHLARRLASGGATVTIASSRFIHERQVAAQAAAGNVVGRVGIAAVADGHDGDNIGGDNWHDGDIGSDNWHDGDIGGDNWHDGDIGDIDSDIGGDICVLRRAHGGHGHVRLAGVADGLAPSDHVPHDVRKVCASLLRAFPRRVLRLARNLRITCIVADVFTLASLGAVAARLPGHVPLVGFWMQSAASYATHLAFTRDHAQLKGLMTTDRPVAFVPGVPASRPSEVNTFLQSCDPSDFFFSFLARCFDTASQQCSQILVNSCDAWEAASLEYIAARSATRPGHVRTIGPVLPSPYLEESFGDSSGHSSGSSSAEGLEAAPMWAENDECLAWLDGHCAGSVLFVSFGSIAQLSAPQMAELERGLEAAAHPVLIVVREIDILPEGLTRLSDAGHFLAVKWAPQLRVLSHPAIGGFLTHCGWNSTLEVMCKGVPMLAWPVIGDQMLNCRAIVDLWQIGLEFHKDTTSGLVSRREIESKVRCLMDPASSEALRERARKLAAMAKQAYHGSSRDNLDAFVASLLK